LGQGEGQDRVIVEPTKGFSEQAFRGAIFTALSQIVKVAVQIISVITLARLLSPSDFGTFAMVGPIYSLAVLLQDSGLAQATIQRASISRQQVSNLFWINIGLGVIVAICLVLCSPLISMFFSNQIAGRLAAALGVPVIIYAICAQPIAMLTRNLRFFALAVIDSASVIAGFLGVLLWALFSPSPWAIYFGCITTTLAFAIGAFVAAAPWRPLMPDRHHEVYDLIKFGAGIVGYNLATFASRNVDSIVIGRFWGGSQLGFYDRAYRLFLFPLQQITNPLSRIMLPILARLKDEPERYAAAFENALGQLLLLTLPGIAVTVGASDIVLPLFLGEDWRPATPIFGALCTAGFAQVLNATAGWLFISQGRTREYSNWGLFSGMTSVAGFLVGVYFGALGVALAYTIVEYFRTPMLWSYALRKGPVRTKALLRLILPMTLSCLASVGIIFLLKQDLKGHPLAQLSFCTAVSYCVFGLTLLLFRVGRELLALSIRTAILNARAFRC
jgi:polysaccharide transporter, PST family